MAPRKNNKYHIDENGEALCAVERKTTASDVVLVDPEFFFQQESVLRCKDCERRFVRTNPPAKQPERLGTIRYTLNPDYEPKGVRRKSVVTMKITDMSVIEDLTQDLQLYGCRLHKEGFADYDDSPATYYYLHAFSYAVDQRSQFVRISHKYDLPFVVRTMNGGHVEGNLKVK